MRVLALLLLSLPGGAHQLPAVSIPINLHDDGRPFVVTLPATIPADTCQVHGAQELANGTRHQMYHRVLGSQTLAIATGRDARSMRAVIWCKGHRVQLIDVPALNASTYQATLAPPPLRSLKVSGRIQPATGVNVAGRELSVRYADLWTCHLSGGSECFFGVREIATTRIAADGSFAFELSDLASDPVARTLRMVTSVRLSIAAETSGADPLPLEPDIEFAAAYPVPFVLTVVKR